MIQQNSSFSQLRLHYPEHFEFRDKNTLKNTFITEKLQETASVSSNTKVVRIENSSFVPMPSLIRSKEVANTEVVFLHFFFVHEKARFLSSGSKY